MSPGNYCKYYQAAPPTLISLRSPPRTTRKPSTKPSQKRAGRFDAHIRMGYPSDTDKQRILDLYLDRFGVSDDFTRRRLQQTLNRDLGRLHLVPAHIEEFGKAGIKRARLARRAPEYLDFEPGIEATKSIAALSHQHRIGSSKVENAHRCGGDREECPACAPRVRSRRKGGEASSAHRLVNRPVFSSPRLDDEAAGPRVEHAEAPHRE